MRLVHIADVVYVSEHLIGTMGKVVVDGLEAVPIHSLKFSSRPSVWHDQYRSGWESTGVVEQAPKASQDVQSASRQAKI